MKKLIRIYIRPFIAICFILIIINSCEKEDNNSPGSSTNGKNTAVFNSSKTYGTMTDQDGNTYKTITIGIQTWMAENLRTTKYLNGETIPEVTGNSAWAELITGAFCSYKNTRNNDTIATYGRLYNWHAVSDSRNIAPAGWHVATDEEWKTLTTYLGGISIASGKMKETGLTHWIKPNTGATNESGFTILPGGYRNGSNGIFGHMNDNGTFWSSTLFNSFGGIGAIFYSFDNDDFDFITTISSYQNGYAVRCIKD